MRKRQSSFGGNWTEAKLKRLAAYLKQYRLIFTKNPKAQFFRTVYVDAFASTGSRMSKTGTLHTEVLPLEMAEEETQAFYKGSAHIALEVDPPFDQYLFIEIDAERYQELSSLKAEFPNRTIQIEQADANSFLQEWCRITDWQKTRAVVFLDPFGMQVDWTLLEALARTQAIDVWLLFPLGMGVMRMLTRNSPPPKAWAETLTRVLGTDAWQSEFYIRRTVTTLFGEEEQEVKDADFAAIQAFFVERLKTIFVGVADNPLVLRNSHNTPLYLLCFAASNPKGAVPAVKIAKHLLKG